MIKTKNIILDYKDVNENFVYEHYLGLSEPLDGSERWLTSVFNSGEKRPSFSLFCKGSTRYMWHDFSSGKGGCALDLVKLMFPEKSKGELIREIIAEYTKYLEGNPTEVGNKQFDKYKVSSFALRRWNSFDKQYWTPYHINSKILDYFNIAPLESFCMSKQEKGETKTITIRRDLIYGFFRKTGEIYKIYQPGTDAKFIKVRGSYLQGFDQLKFQASTLIVNKALKDIAAVHSLGIPNIEQVAPDSENTMITMAQWNTLNFFKRKFILFDDDVAGHAAAKKYEETFEGAKAIFLKISKDSSDSIKSAGPDKVKKELLKLLC